MKRCPACNRTYSDDSLTFCLADGTLLSAPYDPEAVTQRFDAEATQRIPARITDAAQTELLTTNPPPTLVLPHSLAPAYPVKKSNRGALYALFAVLAVLVGVGIFAAVRLGQKPQTSESGLSSSNTGTSNSGITSPSVMQTPSRPASDYLRTPWLGLEVWQDGKASPMYKVDDRHTRISLSSAPFEIRVPRIKNVPVLVTAWKTDKIFDQLKQGEKADEESDSYFNPYKSMADTSAGSATLMLNDDAHGYYDDERVKNISDSQSALYFSTILDGTDNERSIRDQKGNLYLVIFRDLDNNKTIDNGEYEFLILEFK